METETGKCMRSRRYEFIFPLVSTNCCGELVNKILPIRIPTIASFSVFLVRTSYTQERSFSKFLYY